MTIKKIMPLFAIAIVVVLAVGISGFNKADTNGASWYEFFGEASSLDDVLSNTKYRYVSGIQPCSGSNEICGVEANGPTSPNSNPNSFSLELRERLTEVFEGNASYSDIAQQP